MKNLTMHDRHTHALKAMLLIAFFLFNKLAAQDKYEVGKNMYSDAKYFLSLKGKKDNTSYDEALKIASYYDLEFEKKITIDTLYEYTEIKLKSPFLNANDFIFTKKSQRPDNINETIVTSTNWIKTISTAPVSNLDVTTAVSGMARFLAQRAQSELTESFFWGMQKKLDKSKELQFFFPKTYRKLNDTKHLNLSLDLDVLKNSFEFDISNFQDRIYNLTQKKSVNEIKYLEILHAYLTENKTGKWIGLGIETIGKEKNLDEPLTLISNFTNSNIANKIRNENKLNYNLFSSVKLLEFLHQSLQSPSNEGKLISSAELNSLVSNTELFKVYCALLVEKISQEKFVYDEETKEYIDQGIYFITTNVQFDNQEFLTDKENLKTILKGQNNIDEKVVPALQKLIKGLYTNSNALESTIKTLKTSEDKNYYRAIYTSTFNTVIGTLNDFNSLLNSCYYSGIETSLTELNTYSNSVLEIADSFRSKNYKEGIRSLVQVLSMATPNTKDEKTFFTNIESKIAKEMFKTYINEKDNFKRFKNNPKQSIIDDFTEFDIAQKIDDLEKKHIDSLINIYKEDAHFKKFAIAYNAPFRDFVSKLNTYGNLIAAVSVAENSDDVKAAVEKAVLPAGSSRMKRNSSYSITLNAYVGAFAGKAFYKELTEEGFQQKRSITTFGITAPIGVSFNKGLLHSQQSPSTLSLTLQLIDLGSLVNFYLKEGDGAQLPNETKIQLGDILAPGTQLSYSIGDSPFTVMAGVQYVPNLSRMEQFTSNFKPLTWRAQVGLAIDIPLFNLKIWQ